jgi:UDP-N-acetylglucosamine--dolichyl-phosphate N-acetylglucosaminephosphotransferase
MKEDDLFPRAPDQHKSNRPLVPNGLGALYVMASTVYIFLLYFFGVSDAVNGVSAPLTLAVCILFGGFMGLLDDWIDLKWRYKAFLPLVAAIPLATFASRVGTRNSIVLPLLGTIHFGPAYYFIIIPILVTIVTNTVNQLGGLNGLETICPAIVIIGLGMMSISGPHAILLLCPLIVWLLLAFFNFRGKIFVGNTGSFAIGITIAAYAVISDLKWSMVVSILPYIFNSAVILLTFFFYRTKANVSFDGKRLMSNHRRSLITIITFNRPLTERQVVILISLLVAATTLAAVFAQRLLML